MEVLHRNGPVHDFCKEHGIASYIIRDDGAINCHLSVTLRTIDGEIPFKFGKVTGDFKLYTSNLTSLKNMPDEITSSLIINQCTIESTMGITHNIKRNLYLTNCDITSLEGFPDRINGGFDLSYNYNLTSLVGCPQYIGDGFDCSECPIISLEGGPQYVGDVYNFSQTNVKNLIGIPPVIMGDVYAGMTKMDSLLGLNRVENGDIFINNIKSVYAGDVDVFINQDNDCRFHLPLTFRNNTIDCTIIDNQAVFFKYQRHYDIWNEDGSEYNLDNLMILIRDIHDGLL